MGAVDPDDDACRRFVVFHYAFDPERRERRQRAVAAFDNAEEFNALIDTLAERLRLRRQSDESVDPAEYISGTVLEPGHARKQRNARLLRHAITRGVTISDATWTQLTSDLPPGVAVLHLKGDD